MSKKNSIQKFELAKSNLTKINFKSRKVKKILKKLEEENKEIREASRIDTTKLGIRFEF